MEERASKLTDGKPAGYSPTTAVELKSKNIFPALMVFRETKCKMTFSYQKVCFMGSELKQKIHE